MKDKQLGSRGGEGRFSFASTEGLACRNKLPGQKLLLLGDKPPSQSVGRGVLENKGLSGLVC